MFIGVIVLVLLLPALISHADAMFTTAMCWRTPPQQNAVPTVAVVHPTAEKPDEELVLPGTLQAYVESPIYARTNGYLLRWYKDIGSHVKQGELLADIDTPEVDQELMQARAARQQVVAAMDLAKINADRYQSLRKTDSVSQQEADTQSSGYQQAMANLAAADANVKRLQELEGFKHVYAPFDGVHHPANRRSRSADQCRNAGSGAGRRAVRHRAHRSFARLCFRSAGLCSGDLRRNGRGRHFAGVSRTEIHCHGDAHSRRHRYHHSHLADRSGRSQQRRQTASRLLRRSALQAQHQCARKSPFRSTPCCSAREGAQVAVVGSDGKVQLRHITIGRDYGTTLEIVGGVDVNDRVIVNPSDSIEDGQQVNVAPANREASSHEAVDSGGRVSRSADCWPAAR